MQAHTALLKSQGECTKRSYSGRAGDMVIQRQCTKKKQNQDICWTDTNVWPVMMTDCNALVAMPYIPVTMQNELITMHCNAMEICSQLKMQVFKRSHVFLFMMM